MNEELVAVLVELRQDRKLRSSLGRIVRAHQDLDDVFSDVTLKFLANPPELYDNSKLRGYVVSSLYNQAKKRMQDFVRNQVKDNDLIFKIMGHDTFATMFNFFEREATFNKLDEALSCLTDKQKHAIHDLLDVESDDNYYYSGHFKGENASTIRTHRRLAIFKLKSHFDVITKEVNEKYLSIFNDHRAGKITDLKGYLKENNIYYGTYYANIKHLIPADRKVNKRKLTKKQQQALDIQKHVRFHNLVEKRYVEEQGINYNTYKHTLFYVRKKLDVLQAEKETA